MFRTIREYLLYDNHYASLVGIFSFLFLAFLFSNEKKAVKLKPAFFAFLLQWILALLVLKTHLGEAVVAYVAVGFAKLYFFANAGIAFIFGNLANEQGSWGYVFVIKVAPIIIFLASLMALLYHFRVIQIIVKVMAFLIRPLLGTSGAETLCASANSMLGPTDAPLLIKKYLEKMTQSEMFVVMVSGMATISAAVLTVYGSFGISVNHLLTASVMAVPGSILIAKIMIPETKVPETASKKPLNLKSDTTNPIDAITGGAIDGLKMAAIIAAILLAFISLIAMVDFILLAVTKDHYDLNTLFGKVFSHVAWLLGITTQDKEIAGALLGKKLVINEFIAYAELVKATLLPRSQAILTYALCGFANFSVIGILVGGVGALAPSQKQTLTKLGLKALLAGTLVNLLNAAIASLLIK